MTTGLNAGTGTWLCLKQVALVTTDLELVLDQLAQIFDLRVAYRDPMVADFGLHNAVLPIGEQFLEIVAPIEEGTAAGRYLDQRDGPGGYMVITQCGDQAERRTRLAELAVRTVFEFVEGGFSCLQLHPADTGGAFLEIDQQDGPNDDSWAPAGPDWRAAVSTGVIAAILGVRVQCGNLSSVARRWASLLNVGLVDGATGLNLDQGRVVFTPLAGSRGAGLAGVSMRATDEDRAMARAQTIGVRSAEREIVVCGTTFELVAS
jgi:hypothetical protein